MKKEYLVMESNPNTLATFEKLMLLGHTLHEMNGKEYSVQIDFKSDSVKLFVKESKTNNPTMDLYNQLMEALQ